MNRNQDIFTQTGFLIKTILKPIVTRHPRLYRFACQIRTACQELICPTENGFKPPPEHDTPPSPNSLPPVENEPDRIEKLPRWLIREWQAIHEIEPLLFPDIGAEMTVTPENINPVAEIYASLSGQLGDHVTHILLVPWLDRGGADLAAIHYVEAIFHTGANPRVAVIATANADSPWASKLPDQASFIEFGKAACQLHADDQEILLVRLLLQSSPGVIHNVNSRLGYDVFVRFGLALSHGSRLYMSVFCSDFTPEGRAIGYATEYLPRLFDRLTAVSVDNATFLEKLVQLYALDRDKLHLHYQPANFSPLQKEIGRRRKQRLNILWAGRIDHQKRPDILIEIIHACKNFPFHFHIYGASVLNRDVYSDKLAGCENATYYGLFDGLSSLPMETFDVFLYTSQWDGIPTILLDAISLQLPVVASSVGGIGELIQTGHTGFAIEPFDSIMAYVNALVYIHQNPDGVWALVQNACQIVFSRHSWQQFDTQVLSFPGYITDHHEIL
ncbi:MAG: glycosyltransferase family 4 protein [Desulfatirhabdiaceae bacterium]